MSDLDQKIAIVVGAGPGVGRSCAAALARAGATVIVAARRTEPLEALAAEVAAETGATVDAIPVDLSDIDSCQALVTTTIERFGGVDIVASVATRSVHGTVDALSADEWRDAFDVNVIGTLEVSRSAARSMVERGGGSIVHVGTYGVTSRPAAIAAYTATKAAMVSASQTMAKELGRRGVRVNVVTPGYIMGSGLDALMARTAERRRSDVATVSAEMAKTAALRRHVTPDEIADAVVFLAGPRSAAITGVDLPVTAGQGV